MEAKLMSLQGLKEYVSEKTGHQATATRPQLVPNRETRFSPDHEISETARCKSPSISPTRDLLNPTVFHQSWWLDAVTLGRYSVAEVSAGGRTVGRLPYLMRNRLGLQGIWTPPLTYFLGPGIDEGDGSPNNRFLKRMEITRELISKLPRSSWQCIRCHAGITDMIAFQKQGFRTYVQFTHEIQPAPFESLWRQMRNKTRNVIRRAEEQFILEELDDSEEFIRAHETNLAAEGVRDSLDLCACRRVVAAALERRQGRIIAARNGKNQIIAANFCAWDGTTSYYVLSTRSQEAGNGASSLLIWEAIQHAAIRGLTFDFAGLGTQGSVLLYSGFGANVSPRYVAVRASGFARLVADARALLTKEYFFF
jgi:hypothetical protein